MRADRSNYSTIIGPLPQNFKIRLKAFARSSIIHIGDVMLKLKNPYVSVSINGTDSYGGAQQQCSDKSIARCGCGIIAVLDLLLYMHSYRNDVCIKGFPNLASNSPLSMVEYERLVLLLKKYLPLIYPFGMNALTLTLGINAFFRRHNVPYRARWGISRRRLWTLIEEMLADDIPVIMAVGPNFPKFWRKDKAAFYHQDIRGQYLRSGGANAHYITATGMDDNWLQISSWGRMYYMSRDEYIEYIDKHSTDILSNVLYVRQI